MPEVRLQIVRMRDVLKCQAGQFFFGITQDVAQSRIDLQPASIQRYERHADGSIFE